jgi:uncharacterized phage protein gp47/JayE
MPTFRDILSSMISYLQTMGSKLTDFTSTSVIFQIFSSVASVIDQIYYTIQDAQKQAYITTASEDGLDAKGADLGVTRKAAAPAQWQFTFTKKQPSQQQIAIPEGTIITTIPQPGQTPIAFAVDKSDPPLYMPVGSVQVTVTATCKQPGIIGNIAPNTPLLIGSATPGIDGVITPSDKMVGTFGIDRETDDAYRVRLLAALSSKAQGTVMWYQQTALSVQGVTFAKVAPQDAGTGTVFIYIVGANNTVGDPKLLNAVQAVIDAGRIITDNAKVVYPDVYKVDLNLKIQVDKHYDPQDTSSRVTTAVTDYINSLGIGGGALGAVYQSQVAAIALEVLGVVNIVPQNPPVADIVFLPNLLPQAGTITVTSV